MLIVGRSCHSEQAGELQYAGEPLLYTPTRPEQNARGNHDIHALRAPSTATERCRRADALLLINFDLLGSASRRNTCTSRSTCPYPNPGVQQKEIVESNKLSPQPVPMWLFHAICTAGNAQPRRYFRRPRLPSSRESGFQTSSKDLLE